MFAKRVVLTLGLWLAAAMGVAVLSAADPAPALAKSKTVSAKLAKPLTEAQDLLGKKQYQEALTKLQETDQISGHSSLDDFYIAEFRANAYLGLEKWGDAAAEFEKSLGSGEMKKEEETKRLKDIAQLYSQAGNAAKSAEYVDKYTAAAPNDPELPVLLGQLNYDKKNYGEAAKYLSKAISQVEASGQKPDESWIRVLMASYYNSKDKKSYQQTLEKLVKLYPKPEYWSDATLSLLDAPGMNDSRRLAVFRLKMATGGMGGAGDYVEMAETALRLSLPGDAKAAMDKGYATGKLGTGGQAARHQRLKAEATTKAASDLKSLSGIEGEAKGKPTGDPLVNIGEAWLSHGSYDRAITDLKAGMAKGGVTDTTGAKLTLGAAQAGAGQTEAAKATFGGITGGAAGDIARLWIVYLDQPKS